MNDFWSTDSSSDSLIQTSCRRLRPISDVGYCVTQTLTAALKRLVDRLFCWLEFVLVAFRRKVTSS